MRNRLITPFRSFLPFLRVRERGLRNKVNYSLFRSCLAFSVSCHDVFGAPCLRASDLEGAPVRGPPIEVDELGKYSRSSASAATLLKL
jgi:hypothetical protein